MNTRGQHGSRWPCESLGGSVFEAPPAYKEHVGRLLFGLEPQAYDDLLRLLYWLRQPQVGEDIARPGSSPTRGSSGAVSVVWGCCREHPTLAVTRTP